MKIHSKVTIICIKDIMHVTGKSLRSAERLHSSIKKYFNKKRADFVVIDEFCSYTGVPESRVVNMLR